MLFYRITFFGKYYHILYLIVFYLIMNDSKSTCLKKIFGYSLDTSLSGPLHSTCGEVMTTWIVLFTWCLAALSTEQTSLAVRYGRPEVSEKKKPSGRGADI